MKKFLILLFYFIVGLFSLFGIIYVSYLMGFCPNFVISFPGLDSYPDFNLGIVICFYFIVYFASWVMFLRTLSKIFFQNKKED